MRTFADLYLRLDQTNSTNEKLAAMREYFRAARPGDAAWAVYFLSGRKPRQIVPSKELREWATDMAGLSNWMYEECRSTVGDTAETIALLLPDNTRRISVSLEELVVDTLLPLRTSETEERKAVITNLWRSLDVSERLVFNKLISGAFRVGVSQKLVMRALSQEFDIPVDLVALRMMGYDNPSAGAYEDVITQDGADEAPISRPYPFCLAYPLADGPEALGDISDWIAEWKYDGIRCQIIKRSGEVFVWSRGEELVGDTFPEIASAAAELPDGTVIDGEIVVLRGDTIGSFADLQKRIGRKTVPKNVLAEYPAAVIAFDLLEIGGNDVRETPLGERRRLLSSVIGGLPEGNAQLRVLDPVERNSWADLGADWSQSRSFGVEGFMLKRREAGYHTGRKRGDWWKWKVEPFTVDAVLVYAQKGSGRRANLFTDYTFAVWKDGSLVTFAKSYSGLSDEEIREVDRFVRTNTNETFGPVRSVEPRLVFEIAFEGIQRSNRHKSGFAVRFPRIRRWRRDNFSAPKL